MSRVVDTEQRFYRNTRTYRIWGTVLWCVVLLLWSTAWWASHARHPGGSTMWLFRWQPPLWVLLSVLQINTLWSYWDIDATELVAHSFGTKRSIVLSAIEHVGPPAKHRQLLRKTVQVDYRGRRSTYVNVAEPEAFEEALREAVERAGAGPSGVGPLGLVRSSS